MSSAARTAVLWGAAHGAASGDGAARSSTRTPPGTMHIALYDGHEMRYAYSRYYQGRDAAKKRAVLSALTLLRNYLMERAGAELE